MTAIILAYLAGVATPLIIAAVIVGRFVDPRRDDCAPTERDLADPAFEHRELMRGDWRHG